MADKAPSRAAAGQLLAAVPHVNQAMELRRRSSGNVLAMVPMRRPRWLVPPISWIVPFSPHRRVELDPAGAAVLDKCNGVRSVERIIEEFATEHKLSFREAQLPVMQFLRQLTQRGLIVSVGAGPDPNESRP